MARSGYAGVVHVSGPGANVPQAERDLVRSDEDFYGVCCAGAAMYGRDRCTCWEPIYDLEQQPLANSGEPLELIPTRAKCCGDCAYRVGSPEREAGDGDWLVELATGDGRVFWCHQGMRRVVSFRHPDGRELPAGDGDYRPPIGPAERPVAWKANGSVGDRCAGWAAHWRATNLAGEGIASEPRPGGHPANGSRLAADAPSPVRAARAR